LPVIVLIRASVILPGARVVAVRTQGLGGAAPSGTVATRFHTTGPAGSARPQEVEAQGDAVGDARS
jgi:hypothetical protein